MRQEPRRNDTERLFGVLQSRFRVLWEDIGMSYLEDIVKVSETCVILQNLIVRMHQEGEFTEDIQKEEGKINILTEL